MIKTEMMKVKNLFIAGLLMLTGAQSFAQDQPRELSDECKKQLSLMGTYGEQGMWRDAANFFIKAHKACGEENLDQTDWSNARAIYTKLIKAATDETVKSGMQDTLYWAYESELKHFKTPKLQAEYATKLVKDKSKDAEKIDKLYGESVHVLKEKLSINQYIYYYIHVIGKFNTTPQDKKDEFRNYAIDEYIKLSDYISVAVKNNPDRKEAYDKAQNYLDKYFSQLVKDCDKLTSVLGGRLNSLPVDKDEKLAKIQTYLNLLDMRGCGQTDLYGQLADSSIAIKPTAVAYYSQGNFFKKKEDLAKAIDYYKKAIEMEGETGENIDQYQYALASAQLSSKKYRAAFSTAKKVQGELKGKAMLICAGAIGATANSCGDTTFDRKANNWLADDYMKKASALGEEYSSRYTSRAPGTEEFFEAGKKAGDRMTLSCWGESTTIR